jgi:hypothetical protein
MRVFTYIEQYRNGKDDVFQSIHLDPESCLISCRSLFYLLNKSDHWIQLKMVDDSGEIIVWSYWWIDNIGYAGDVI